MVALLDANLVERNLWRIKLEGVGVEGSGDHQDIGGDQLGVFDGIPRLGGFGLLEDVGVELLDLGPAFLGLELESALFPGHQGDLGIFQVIVCVARGWSDEDVVRR